MSGLALVTDLEVETNINQSANDAAEHARPRYRTPPIIEAVIELRFAGELDERLFNRLAARYEKKYEQSKREQLVEVTVSFDTATPTVHNKKPLQRWSSTDQTDILILKTNALTWSRLPPYEGWKSFMKRVERDLEILTKVAGARRLERIGVRFINRIDVPLDAETALFRYEDYLTIKLDLPPMFDSIDAYQWRVSRTFPEKGLVAMVASGTMPPEIPGTSAFLLDIDVSATPDTPLDQAEILAKLYAMRDLKNEIFELAVTPLAREGFR